MPRIVGWARIRGPPFLPHKKLPYVKIYEIPRIALKYSIFRTLKMVKK